MQELKSGTGNLRQLLMKKIENGERILITYHTLGYPNLKNSVKIIEKAIIQGIDVIEIGFPHSDPIADGPIIQKTSQHALNNGIKFNQFWTVVTELKEKYNTPLVLMTYYNIILQYGLVNFVDKIRETKLDGVIIPDLTLEMTPEILKNANLVYLIGPNTKFSRANKLIEATGGFIYVISHFGITGKKNILDDNIIKLVKKLKETNKHIPFLVGFGISTPDQIKFALQKGFDGVIIGSSLLNKIEQGKDILEDYLKCIRIACSENIRSN
jgi:tryptophan synthase alpha chain